MTNRREDGGKAIRRGSLGLVLLTIATGVLPVFAAQMPDAQQLPPVVVTGSRIEHLQTETLSPVTVISRDQIRASGAASAAELLFQFAMNSGGAPNEMNAGGLFANPGYGAIDLRGLGANATLVLVNGRRVAPFAFSGEAVDLNSIPLGAIERIEILRDGASAQYGADAVAGVVNFILRRDYHGAEVTVGRLAPTEGGATSDRLSFSLGHGPTPDGRLSGFIGFDFRQQAALRAVDREFASTAYRPERGYDQTSVFGFPGAYSFDTSTPFTAFSSAGLGCPTKLTRGAILVNDLCRYDYVIESDIIPRTRKASVFGRVNITLGADTRAYAEMHFTDNQYRYRSSPTPVWGGASASGLPFVLPAASPYNPFGTDVQFWWRTTELGPRTLDVEAQGHRLVAGVERNAGAWDFDIGVGSSESRNRQFFRSGYLSETRFRDLLAAGGRVNPFGPTSTADLAVLQSAQATGLARSATAGVRWWDAKAVGIVGEWQGRPINIAIGMEQRWESQVDSPTALMTSGDVIGDVSAAIPRDGSRRAAALYGELLFPAGRALDLQLSARADHTNDFGAAYTPKAAARWKVTPWLAIRGSAGSSFRAPNLAELYTAQGGGFSAPLDDPLRCPGGTPLPGANPATDCAASFAQLGGGNPQLKPEKARQGSIGLVLEPLPGATFGVNYWTIMKSGNIGIVRDSVILDPRFQSGLSSLIIRRAPTALDVANGLPGAIDQVNVTLQNLGEGQVSGWDFEMGLRGLPAWGGRLSSQILATLTSRYVQQLFTGGESVDMLGRRINGTPLPRWRANMGVEWRRGPWGINVNGNYVGRYDDENANPDGTTAVVGQQWTFDLLGRYAWGGWELRAGARNLFNRQPPFSNQVSAFAAGWDDLVHDPRGRMLLVEFTYTAVRRP